MALYVVASLIVCQCVIRSPRHAASPPLVPLLSEAYYLLSMMPLSLVTVTTTLEQQTQQTVMAELRSLSAILANNSEKFTQELENAGYENYSFDSPDASLTVVDSDAKARR